jgi:hypothetical protein
MKNKNFKFFSGSFLAVFLGCWMASSLLLANPQLIDLNKEIAEAKKSYFKQDYVDAVLKLSALEKRVSNYKTLKNKTAVLAEIHFLSGLCILEGWDHREKTKKSFSKTLFYNPSFRVDQDIYGKDAALAFAELAEITAPADNPPDRQESEQTASMESHESYQVRIIQKNAVLRLKPKPKSVILRILPLGALLTVEEKYGDWLKIKMPPDRDGFIVSGYLHNLFTEDASIIHK